MYSDPETALAAYNAENPQKVTKVAENSKPMTEKELELKVNGWERF